MPSFVSGYNAICQTCGGRFRVDDVFTTVVNLDIEGFEKQKFLDKSLNRVRCTHCKAEFTYEIPMVVFSLTMGFAVNVIPSLTPENIKTLKPPPHILFPGDFRFRAVRYMTEAREKYKLELAGLSDAAVEYIKLVCFDDEAAMPFHEKSLLFAGCKNNVYTFCQVDFNDKPTDSYIVEYNSDNIPERIFDLTKSRGKWLKIDRESLKEEI